MKRASKIIVAGQLPLSGERVLITTDAFEARALQHEIDHCKGMLFLDRVIGAHALYARKVYLAPRVTAGFLSCAALLDRTWCGPIGLG